MKQMYILLISIICTNSIIYGSDQDLKPSCPSSPKLDNQHQIALAWINSASPKTLRECPRIAQFVDDEIKALARQGQVCTIDDLRGLAARGLLFTRSELAAHDKQVGEMAVLEWRTAHAQNELNMRQAENDRLDQAMQNNRQRMHYVKKHPIRAILIAAGVTTGIGCTLGLWQAGYF